MKKLHNTTACFITSPCLSAHFEDIFQRYFLCITTRRRVEANIDISPFMWRARIGTWDLIHITDRLSRYSDFHYYLYNGISYTDKTVSLYRDVHPRMVIAVATNAHPTVLWHQQSQLRNHNLLAYVWYDIEILIINVIIAKGIPCGPFY